MEDNRKNCPLRHENGDCLPFGGFCAAVNNGVCEIIQQAYQHGFNDGYRQAEADDLYDMPCFGLCKED